MQPSTLTRKTGAELQPGDLVLAADEATVGQVVLVGTEKAVKVGDDTYGVHPAKIYPVVAEDTERHLFPALEHLAGWVEGYRLGEPDAKLQFTLKANLDSEGHLTDVLYSGWGYGIRINLDGDLESLKRGTHAAMLRLQEMNRRWPAAPGSTRDQLDTQRRTRLEAFASLLDAVEVLKAPVSIPEINADA